MKLKEVFTPGGQPSVTYVGREHLNLEATVRTALAQGYALNVVTGPTKSGKTVLCTRVIQGTEFIVIEGGQVRTEDDFWKQIAYSLNIGKTASKAISRSTGDQTATDLSGGIPAIIGGRMSHQSSNGETKSSSVAYESVYIIECVKRLLADDVTLMVDDFHYIIPDVQKSIIQALKGAIYKGLSVIFLAVPHRAFDAISVEDELQGRFRHIAIPPWSIDDLRKIAEKGFDALNVKCSQFMIQEICEESYGNPLLVQEICSDLCTRSGIFESQAEAANIEVSTLPLTLAAVAESKGFPKYRKLKEGPQSRKDRLPRKLKNGESADIYESVMMALARLGPKPRTQYDELRSALKDILEDSQMPQKNEITAALTHMNKIATEKIEGEPPIEFVKSEDAFVITDPFLLFYMKWQKDKSAPGSKIN